MNAAKARETPARPPARMKKYLVRKHGKQKVLATVWAWSGAAACGNYASSVGDWNVGDYWYEHVKED